MLGGIGISQEHADCVSGLALASYVIGNGSTHSVNETKDMNNFLNGESHLRAHVVELKGKFVSQLLVQPIKQSLFNSDIKVKIMQYSVEEAKSKYVKIGCQ